MTTCAYVTTYRYDLSERDGGELDEGMIEMGLLTDTDKYKYTHG